MLNDYYYSFINYSSNYYIWKLVKIIPSSHLRSFPQFLKIHFYGNIFCMLPYCFSHSQILNNVLSMHDKNGSLIYYYIMIRQLVLSLCKEHIHIYRGAPIHCSSVFFIIMLYYNQDKKYIYKFTLDNINVNLFNLRQLDFPVWQFNFHMRWSDFHIWQIDFTIDKINFTYDEYNLSFDKSFFIYVKLNFIFDNTYFICDKLSLVFAKLTWKGYSMDYMERGSHTIVYLAHGNNKNK